MKTTLKLLTTAIALSLGLAATSAQAQPIFSQRTSAYSITFGSTNLNSASTAYSVTSTLPSGGEFGGLWCSHEKRMART